jgi:hypothetical protein
MTDDSQLRISVHFPPKLVKVRPKADFFRGWQDTVETFHQAVAREVTVELHDHLKAIGHSI